MELTHIQKQIITTEESKVLVQAAAASGKTACLIERLNWLLQMGQDPKKIVAITFTNNAAAEIKERLIMEANGLFIGTVHSYCNYLLRAGGVATDKILDEDRFDDLFPLIKDNPHCIREVDHLIVDEAQDSTAAQFEFFELLSPKNFMHFYDLRQSIYGFAGSDPDYLINLRHQDDVTIYELNQNYRNGTAILNQAKKIINSLGREFQDHSIPMRHTQGKFVHGELSYEAIVKTLENEKFGDWFILCRSNKEVETMCFVLKKNGIPYDTFKQGDLNNQQIQDRMKADTVKVLTVHSAKGLEANKVLVYDPRLYNDEERRLYYVAATRARDVLLWIKPPKKGKKKTTNWE